MAKAPKFKYTITAEVSFPTKIGVKELKEVAQEELSYITSAEDSYIKVGKVTVVAQ